MILVESKNNMGLVNIRNPKNTGSEKSYFLPTQNYVRKRFIKRPKASTVFGLELGYRDQCLISIFCELIRLILSLYDIPHGNRPL